ncbi:Conserved_hypothetical protein [Hexamita inflata]|uniref:Uncharacterized protein n=1 Tax=Hexamita inflata TaxID=28002 RepID=A0ABP1HC67_9EUKA
MSGHNEQTMQMVEENVKCVQESIDCYNKNKLMRNLARQLRTEAPAGFVCLRDAPLPADDLYKPYVLLHDVDVIQRRSFGQQIFDRVCNYLRLLAARSLFPRGELSRQVIVLFSESNELESIQLVPKYLTRKQQSIHQLAAFRDFLFASTSFPETSLPIDFYFQKSSQGIYEPHDLSQVAILVQSAEEIDLQQNPGMVFINGVKVLTTQQIFEAKSSSFSNQINLWIMLARFCNEHTHVQHLNLLPLWLNDFVKYENPTELPSEFRDNANCQNALETLRIVLGIYPQKIELKENEYVDEVLLQESETLPIWFQQKFTQMGFSAVEITEGKTENKGVYMQCEAKEIVQLIQMYE